jgi:hypothetical protein
MLYYCMYCGNYSVTSSTLVKLNSITSKNVTISAYQCNIAIATVAATRMAPHI